MKRRTFLTAASTVGIVGAASGATIATSVYNNLSLSVLLEEFDTPAKKVLDKFEADVIENAESHELDVNLAKRIVLPAQIISKDTKNGVQTMIYKNKCGHVVSLSISKDDSKVALKPM